MRDVQNIQIRFRGILVAEVATDKTGSMGISVIRWCMLVAACSLESFYDCPILCFIIN